MNAKDNYIIINTWCQKIFAVNKIDGIKDSNQLIKKCRKLFKTRKLSKSRNLKGKKLS